MRRRSSPRLRDFDYSKDGWHFVTFTTRGRRCTLGRVDDARVVLSAIGRIAEAQIERLPRLPGVDVDAFVVMPNHVHAIAVLSRARQASPLRLGDIVGAVKAGSSREAGTPLWQRGYHDHVVRDKPDLARIREYIRSNPIRLALDLENPSGVPRAP